MQYNYRKTKTQQRNEQFLNKNPQNEKGNDIKKRTGKEFHTRTMQDKELIKNPITDSAQKTQDRRQRKRRIW